MLIRKAVYLDSSSAILLEKTGLLKALLEAYRVIQTEAVYQELTTNSYPSAGLFRETLEKSQIEVQALTENPPINRQFLNTLSAMGKGEADTIRQFLAGSGGFIMLDDGQGARFCLKQQIPFINALLFPRILYLAKRLSCRNSEAKIKEIKQVGRYSAKIIIEAQQLSEADLLQFLP